MQNLQIKQSFMDFKKALGINHFSKELSETEFKLISLVSDAYDNNENINLITISNELNITRSAVTQLVKKLEEKGYVERYMLNTNKKEIYLKVGNKAISQYNNIMEKISYFFEKLYAEVGQEGMDDIERYIQIFKKIGKEMKEECECEC